MTFIIALIKKIIQILTQVYIISIDMSNHFLTFLKTFSLSVHFLKKIRSSLYTITNLLTNFNPLLGFF